MIEYRAFFGDGEKLFAFPTRDLIEELERKTGNGVGALLWRLRNNEFTFMEMVEVIRLGLIGGGTTPADASRLVTVYAVGRPWTETHLIAVGIINAVFFGSEEGEAHGGNGQVAA